MNFENINVLALDVDGVLTDGTITLSADGSSESKTFHVHDGQGIALWKRMGFWVVIISGRNAKAVDKRAQELSISHVYQGSRNKIADLQEALDKIGSTLQQTVFVGDDLGDMQIMQEVGYAIAVQNAVQEIQQLANWITPRRGGQGAVRDAIEHVLKRADNWDTAIESIKSEATVQ